MKNLMSKQEDAQQLKQPPVKCLKKLAPKDELALKGEIFFCQVF